MNMAPAPADTAACRTRPMDSAPPRPVRRGGVGTGTTSLLMIFTVLCFAMLAVLSLATAESSRRTQQRGVTNAAAVAAAKGAAAEKAAELDAALFDMWELHSRALHSSPQLMLDLTEPYEVTATGIAEGLGFSPGAENATLLYITPVDDTSELVTELRLLAPGGALRYEVVRQNTRLTGGWAPEGGGGVWIP